MLPRYALAAASTIALATTSPEFAARADEEPLEARAVRAAIGLAPLDVLIGRFALVGTMLVAPHHALTATLHGDYMSGDQFLWKPAGQTLAGLGAEFGWHVHTRGDQLRGFWFGPSVVFATFSAQDAIPPSRAYTATGVAFDAGGTASDGRIVFDFALGLQVTHLTNDDSPPSIVSLIAGGGPRPRVILGIGLPL